MADNKPFGQTFGGQMLAGAGGSLLNGLFNIGAAKRQYKYQSKLQQQQYDLNERAAESAFGRQQQFYEQQRDDQRQWEDPSAIKSRYENAGINPTAAFGTAGSYSPMQSPSGAVGNQQGVGLGNASAFPIADPIEQAYRLAMIRNVDAQTAKTESETGDRNEFLRGQRLANDLKDAGLISQDLANQLDSLNLQFKTEVYDTEVQVRKQTADNMAKQFEQMNQQIAESASRQTLNDEQAKQYASVIALNTAQAILAKTQSLWHGKVSQAKIDEALARIENLAADSNFKSAQQVTEFAKQANLFAQKGYYESSSRLKDSDAEYSERTNSAYKSTVGQFIFDLGAALKQVIPFGKLK